MNIVVSTKNTEKWSEISDFIIPILNLVVVTELMKIWSIAVTVFIVTRVGLFTTGITIILTKFCAILFCSKSSRFILKSPFIITSFFGMSFVDSIWFKCFSNSFTSPLGGPYVKFRITFFNFLFVISRHNDSVVSQFVDKSCLVLQQNDYFRKRHHVLDPLWYCLYW